MFKLVNKKIIRLEAKVLYVKLGFSGPMAYVFRLVCFYDANVINSSYFQYIAELSIKQP